MALVKDVNHGDGTGDPFYEIKGIITLEDIIEVILGDQIIDETDAWVDVDHTKKVNRREDFDWARLRLLDSKIVDQTLSEDEARAVAAHLSSNYSSVFDVISNKQLMRMVTATPVLELEEDTKELHEFLPSSLMYEKDTPADKCTLILGGKVTVIAGADNFRSDLSSWSLLAPRALSDELYTPDFSAYVSSGPCRCLQFTREIFGAAVAASNLEAMPLVQEDSEEEEEEKVDEKPLSILKSKDTPKINSKISRVSFSQTSSRSDDVPVPNLHTEQVAQRGKLLQKLLKETSNREMDSEAQPLSSPLASHSEDDAQDIP